MHIPENCTTAGGLVPWPRVWDYSSRYHFPLGFPSILSATVAVCGPRSLSYTVFPVATNVITPDAPYSAGYATSSVLPARSFATRKEYPWKVWPVAPLAFSEPTRLSGEFRGRIVDVAVVTVSVALAFVMALQTSMAAASFSPSSRARISSEPESESNRHLPSVATRGIGNGQFSAPTYNPVEPSGSRTRRCISRYL